MEPATQGGVYSALKVNVTRSPRGEGGLGSWWRLPAGEVLFL